MRRARAGPRPAVACPGAPARIGATIGALERLLIVAFMLAGAGAAVGFVIAAKTIARFKQLDDRGFAEYYLLGTLASVAVAIARRVALAAPAACPDALDKVARDLLPHSRSKNGSPSRRTSRPTRTSNAGRVGRHPPRARMSTSNRRRYQR